MSAKGAALTLAIVVILSLTDARAQPPPSSPAPATLPPTRRDVRIALTSLPATFDPQGALDGSAALVARQLVDTLVAYREWSTDVEPALALRWSVSRDGLTWTFALRDGARFHDGTPLTAREAATSFERWLRPDPRAGGSPVVWAALLRGVPGVIREVRAADAHTLQFVLAQPYAPLLTVLAHPGFGITKPAPEGGFAPIGSGPYRLAEIGPGRVVLEAVSGHWSGGARAERLVFVEVPSDERAEADMDGRAIDLWFPSGAPRRPEGALSVPGLQVGFLTIQTEKGPFARKKVRQAMATALDPAVLGLALGRAAVPLLSFLPPGVWARREGAPVIGGSRQTVAALLKEGGYTPGKTTLLLSAGDATGVDRARLAEVVQTLLLAGEIGVELRLDSADAVRATAQSGGHDLLLAEAVVAGGDPHLLLYPLSTSEGAEKGSRATNLSFYRNPRLDDVLVRASQLSFRPERQRLYQRAQAMLADDVPWIPLYVRLLWAVARPEVRNLRLHPSGLHRLHTVWLEPTP